MKTVTRAIFLLALIGMVSTATIVQADLKATNVVYAWDFVANKFQNSLVIIYYDGTWVPFLHEIYYDTDIWVQPPAVVPPEPLDPPGWGLVCNPATQWQGYMYYGLYHEDNSPLGGAAFEQTRNWSLIKCDMTGDGKFTNADLAHWPSDRVTLADCVPYVPNTPPSSYGACTLIYEDHLQACTTGNCLDEIVTKFMINVDLDCNGTIDPLFTPAGGVCFYAEAQPANNPAIPWGGNPQARISTVGGEKTVNFRMEPTAVEIGSFAATPRYKGVHLEWETLSEVDNLGFNLYRSEGLYGELTKLNGTLIPSLVPPGSPVGASYGWWDYDVVPGTTYYYWLQDVSVWDTSNWSAPEVMVKAHYPVFLPLSVR